MADTVSKSTRSKIMSRVRHRDTPQERAVRGLLHRLGYRFRLNYRKLPGTPDIVLPKHRAAIFVHGCFWHQHPGCRLATRPSTNLEYWEKKLDDNVRRDKNAEKRLTALGWRTLVVWQCELARPTKVVARLKQFLSPKIKKDIRKRSAKTKT